MFSDQVVQIIVCFGVYLELAKWRHVSACFRAAEAGAEADAATSRALDRGSAHVVVSACRFAVLAQPVKVLILG